MNKFKLLLIAVVLGVSSTAQAALIEGSIAFTGEYTHNGTANLSDATTITPSNAAVGLFGSVFGDFTSTVSGGDLVSYSAFTFDPITVPVANIWSVGGFSFTLEDMFVISKSADTVALNGTGTISSTNVALDDTAGFWTFTANQNSLALTFSSGTNSVPEPGIVALFALGLLGMGVSRKLKQNRG